MQSTLQKEKGKEVGKKIPSEKERKRKGMGKTKEKKKKWVKKQTNSNLIKW